MDELHHTKNAGDRLAWLGLALVTMMCLVRAMVEHDPFPWWQSDPFVFSPPITGLTPRWALLLNAGLILASCLSLLGHAVAGRGIGTRSGALLAVGIAVLGYHTLIDPERVLPGSSIAAVIAVLACASMMHALPGASRVVGAVALGFGTLLTCVGVYEVFVSHPLTLEMYEQGRESFLAARGWSAESFEAQAYERRLHNPEPIAWFGLTNVFASFTAASAAGLVAIALHARGRSVMIRTGLLLAALMCGLGLFLAGSKGGYGVLVIGIALAVASWQGFRRVLNGRVVLLLCLGALMALVLRGVLGEQLGERSLLFRWQYLVGSLNIWLHHPIVGCGPGAYQQQYALHKPELSPEDVASAHNFMLDWLAVLGIGGIALIAFACRSILRIGLGTQSEPEQGEQAAGPDWHWKLALLCVVVPTLVALNMQSAVLNLAGIAPVLVGAVIWGAVALVIIRSSMSDRMLRAGLVVGGAVLCVHGMLEVTGTLITSGPLWALLIGAAVCGPRERKKHGFGWLPVGVLLGMGLVILARWPMLNRWERALHSAAQPAQTIAMINSTLNDLESSPDPQRELRFAQQQLFELFGRTVSPTLDSIIPELNRVEVESRQYAIERLQWALDARPSHTPTRVALSQQLLWIASVAQSSGRVDLATQMWARATQLFDGPGLNAGGHRWAGSIWAGRAASSPDAPERADWLEQARSHWERAIALAPHDPQTALMLMENAIERDDAESARDWAKRAVILHTQTRFDPLRGLSPADLNQAQRVAAD